MRCYRLVAVAVAAAVAVAVAVAETQGRVDFGPRSDH
jgi:hypothetical protein